MVASDGSADLPLPKRPSGDVTADALTPAWSPAVYNTPAYRRNLAVAVAQRLREEQARLDDLEAWCGALERLERYLPPRTLRGTH